ncbi:FkbM family methyltransferase [Selenomonas ruminantium]|uniref:Methyltransferase, FkbM family n=1 Tax=Selenomonas ruminantium TaxID=971 RepID=A0A1H0S268_SELRU|nr:FkbM family methyltransferase [Selenomonas ruminantium]SDP35813.1 methyltransferase, FkbM family [Selenomonas ruminantium]
MTFFDKCVDVYNRLSDDTSKSIFDARMQCMLGKIDKWKMSTMLQGEQKYNLNCFLQKDFDRYFTEGKSVVVFGAGAVGKYTAKLLCGGGITDITFCDSSSENSGKVVDGINVISFDELCNLDKEYIVVLGSFNYAREMYEQCLWAGIDREKIYYPSRGFLTGYTGRQYFDFFQPNTGEVFVDAGAYNGMTSVDFAKWTNNSYEKIYMMEANPDNEALCHQAMKEYSVKNYNLITKGAWNQDGEVSFNRTNCGAGSQIDIRNGSEKISTTTIDKMLLGEKATFIKMDIEGAEYQALEGAKETIQKYSPRLAISVYHKDNDFVVLPDLILQLNSNYQFTFRHYSSWWEETVLYAWC